MQIPHAIDLPTLEPVIIPSHLNVKKNTLIVDVITLMSQGRGSELSLSDEDSGSELNLPSQKPSSCALVVEDTQVIGIFTERDVVRAIAAGVDLSKTEIAQVMTQPVITLALSATENVLTALSAMRQHRIRHLPVVDEQGKLVGLVTQDRLYQAIAPAQMLRLTQQVETARLEAKPKRPKGKRQTVEISPSESEERYRDLFENASDLIQSCALNGQFVYVNRAWRETLGYSAAQVEQMNLLDVIHPDNKREWLEIFSRVISGEKLDQVTAAFISNEGQKISVEGNINCRFVAGKPVATRAVLRDITERLQTEEALRQQQEQTERLLLNILPEPIADLLKQDTSTIAENFSEVSVMFADIVGFTQMASSLSPNDLINVLNQVFSAFDRLSEKHGLEKIKTVGDAYMVVGGLPTRRADHAEAIAEMALDIQSAIAQFREETGKDFNIRIGINTGPVVAGVIGIKKFSYDLWGDTVNIASRMESHGTLQLTIAYESNTCLPNEVQSRLKARGK